MVKKLVQKDFEKLSTHFFKFFLSSQLITIYQEGSLWNLAGFLILFHLF